MAALSNYWVGVMIDIDEIRKDRGMISADASARDVWLSIALKYVLAFERRENGPPFTEPLGPKMLPKEGLDAIRMLSEALNRDPASMAEGLASWLVSIALVAGHIGPEVVEVAVEFMTAESPAPVFEDIASCKGHIAPELPADCD